MFNEANPRLLHGLSQIKAFVLQVVNVIQFYWADSRNNYA